MRKALLFLFAFLLLFSSCSVDRRVYRKGIYIERKGKSKEVEKNNSPAVSKDSVSSPDPHIAIYDSIQKILPPDTGSVEKGKRHRADNHEIVLQPRDHTHAHAEKNHGDHHSPVHHPKKKKHHKHHKKKKHHHHKKQHQAHAPPAKGKQHKHGKFRIPFLGWLVYWLAWLSWITLVLYCYLMRYLDMGDAGEWDFMFLILLLSAAFGILALLLIPLARYFDSGHDHLTDEGIKNLKIVSIPLLILLLLNGAIVLISCLL